MIPYHGSFMEVERVFPWLTDLLAGYLEEKGVQIA